MIPFPALQDELPEQGTEAWGLLLPRCGGNEVFQRRWRLCSCKFIYHLVVIIYTWLSVSLYGRAKFRTLVRNVALIWFNYLDFTVLALICGVCCIGSCMVLFQLNYLDFAGLSTFPLLQQAFFATSHARGCVYSTSFIQW
jgi:hypothetical protein